MITTYTDLYIVLFLHIFKYNNISQKGNKIQVKTSYLLTNIHKIILYRLYINIFRPVN